MKKHKNIFKYIGIFGTATIFSIGCITASYISHNNQKNSNLTSSTNSNDASTIKYEPITIASGYNANTIIGASGDTTSTTVGWRNVQACDDNHLRTNNDEITASPSDFNNASIYLASAAKSAGASSYSGLDDPDEDGYTYIDSQYDPTGTSSTTKPKWKIPVSKTENTLNTMKLFGTSESTNKGTFTFKDIGVYNKLYILCLVANCPKNTTPCKFTALINYSDGTQSTATTYECYDWFPGDFFSTLTSKNQVATTKYSRFWFWGNSSSSITKDWNSGSGNKDVCFNQCAISVDTNKLIKSVDIQLTDTGSSNTAVLDVYGVTGAVANIDPPSADELKIKASGTTYSAVDITWSAVSGATSYYLDISTDSKFEDSSKFVLQNIQVWNSTTGGDLKYTATGLTPNNTYYARMRSANSAGQSDSSNVVSFNTNVDADSLALNPTSATILTGKTTQVISTVKGPSESLPVLNQNVTWSGDAIGNIVNITTDTSDPTKHTVTALKPGDAVLTATSVAGSKTNTCTITVNPNTPTINDPTLITHKSFNFNFTEPDEATTSDYSYVVQYSTDSSFTSPTTIDVNHDETKSHIVAIENLNPLTKYYVRVKTKYGSDKESDWVTKETTTTDIPANYITLGGNSEIDVSKTTTITSTIYGPDSPFQEATYQDITWSSNVTNWQDYLDITTDTDKKTHTIKAKKAYQSSSGTITLKATSTKYPTISKTIDITINLPKTYIDALIPTTDSLTVSWPAVDGVDSYKLYYAKASEQTYNSVSVDKSKTQYKIENLDPVTEYKVYVDTVSNNITNSSDTKTSTTNPQQATGVTINPTSKTVLLGEQFNVTSQVAGSAKHEATNQVVTSTKTSGTAEVELTDDTQNPKNHTVKAIKQGTDAVVTYTAQGTSYSTTCTISVVNAKTNAATNNAYNEFTANWEDIKASDYYLDVSTDSTFTDETKFVEGYNNLHVTSCSQVVTGLLPKTTYYYRVRYSNNGLTSESSNITSVTTLSDVSGIKLNTNEIEIAPKEISETLTATVQHINPLPKKVIWSIVDSSIANIQEITTNDNESKLKITALKPGITTISATIEGYPEITAQTCKLTVTTPDLKAPVPNIKDITATSFTVYWDPVESYSSVKYIINVWHTDEKGQKETICSAETIQTEYKIDKQTFKKLTPGGQYSLTVRVENGTTGATSNVLTVTLLTLPNNLPAIIGGTVGGGVALWLLLSYILYLLWKNSILITYDQKKARDKAKGKKVKTHDGYFRIIDKACVATNSAITKRKNSLMTKLGTKNEQKEE